MNNKTLVMMKMRGMLRKEIGSLDNRIKKATTPLQEDSIMAELWEEDVEGAEVEVK